MPEAQTALPPVFQYAWLIIILPFVGMLINIFGGKRRSEKTIGWTAVLFSGLAFAVALVVVIALGNLPEEQRLAGVNVPGYTFLSIGSMHVEFGLHIDDLTAVMLMVVTGVGSLIHVYAIGYMHGDSRFQRFFVYFNLFMAMMLILVLANNYLMMFVGWEGVGLCSFLLIGFWFEKDANGDAAKKAMVANRVGDWGVLLAMFAMFLGLGSLQFTDVFAKAGSVPKDLITLITLLLLIGVTGKSAQIPLYVWLPDAMAGPTPVSALIHAATMVTAGVYLIARSQPLFQLVPDVQSFIGTLGAVTAVWAGLIAVAQFDIKKVLAYSTVSQLGFMVAAVGMGAVAAGIFHLMTHAFFKALLFLGAGSVIHGVEHGHHHVAHQAHDAPEADVGHGGSSGHGDDAEEEFDPQDMRNMGGLRHRLRTTWIVYLIGSLALMGIIPFAGFWSKDEILLAASKQSNQSIIILLIVGAFLTAFYMTRQLIMVFFGPPKSEAAAHAAESPRIMTVPLIILAFFSTVAGFINAALFNFTPLATWLEGAEAHPEFNIVLAGLVLLLAFAAIGLAYILYRPEAQKAGVDDPLRRLGRVFTFFNKKGLIDELYGLLFVRPYIRLSNFLALILDWRFWHDWFHERVLRDTFLKITDFLANPIDKLVIDGAVNGTGRLVARASGGLRKLQTGFVRNYALLMLAGVVLVVAWFTLIVMLGR